MITRLIARILTPVVAKSRFMAIRGVPGVISHRPYLDLPAPARHGCRTTLVVKQGTDGFPVYRRAHLGYLHLDIKTRTPKQASRRVKSLVKIQAVGQFTSWGYGKIQWLFQKRYEGSTPPQLPYVRFRILKGLPPNLSPRERQLVTAALLHDLVDTPTHASKFGPSVRSPDPYVRWLCVHHHARKAYPTNPDLPLLQAADVRTARYARLLAQPTRRRKLAPVNTNRLARQLQVAAHHSVYKLYTVIYQSAELARLTASKAHPTETLRNHLIGVANWTLFLVRTHTGPFPSAAADLTGDPGATPGPVEMEDPGVTDEP